MPIKLQNSVEITPYSARFEGKMIQVTYERQVGGGIACDIRRHPTVREWPYFLTSWTEAKENLSDL